MIEDEEVKVGQVWADKDRRRGGRQLRVEQIADGYAVCSTRSHEQAEFGRSRRRIRLDRMKRYRLIRDAERGEQLTSIEDS